MDIPNGFSLAAALREILAKAGIIPNPDPGPLEYSGQKEDEIRKIMIETADYAEHTAKFDPEGKYLCGTCSLRIEPSGCGFVKGTISMETGSCRIYIHGPEQGKQFVLASKLAKDLVAYTERPNDKAFGCSRCQFGTTAQREDDEGRRVWCGYFGAHVNKNSCCAFNKGKDDKPSS